MLALLIIPILICGYTLLKHHPHHFLVFHQYAGQSLYLKVIVYGVICLFVGLLVQLISPYALNVIYSVSSKLEIPLNALEPVAHYAGVIWNDFRGVYFTRIKEEDKALANHIIALCIFTPVFTRVYCACLKRVYKRLQLDYAATRAAFTHDPMILFLFDQTLASDPVLITLRNSKVYLGLVLDLGEPTDTNGIYESIAMLPLASGYRDEKQNVHLTTHYADASGESAPKVHFNQKDITTVAPFDFKYESGLRKRKLDVGSLSQ